MKLHIFQTNTSLNTDIHKVPHIFTLSLGPPFIPLTPLFQWYPDSKEILLNLSMKCWNSVRNAESQATQSSSRVKNKVKVKLVLHWGLGSRYLLLHRFWVTPHIISPFSLLHFSIIKSCGKEDLKRFDPRLCLLSDWFDY
jgi:hypothetical protein